MRLPTYLPVLLVFLVAGRLTDARSWSEGYHSRSLNDNIIYREYQAGDIMSRVDSRGTDFCRRNPCFVAVDTSISRKAVVGVVEMHIPAVGLKGDILQAILDLMPEPSREKDKIIGYIDELRVAKDWQGKKIGQELINKTFEYLGRTRPNLVAMYLMVDKNLPVAIHVYEKTGFLRLKYETQLFYYYARYRIA